MTEPPRQLPAAGDRAADVVARRLPPVVEGESAREVDPSRAGRAGHASRTKRTKLRLVLALAVAIASDLVGAPLELAPPLSLALDALTAALLWVILGRGWMLLVALALEAVPGVGVMPLWTLAVLATALQPPSPPDPRVQSSSHSGPNAKS